MARKVAELAYRNITDGKPVSWSDGNSTVWNFNRPVKSDLHPTMKPIALIAEALLNSSREGDIVTDIFGGSGSTLIACEQTGRRCRMMELDPRYVDVIIKRWEEFTGRTAELVSGAGE